MVMSGSVNSVGNSALTSAVVSVQDSLETLAPAIYKPLNTFVGLLCALCGGCGVYCLVSGGLRLSKGAAQAKTVSPRSQFSTEVKSDNYTHLFFFFNFCRKPDGWFYRGSPARVLGWRDAWRGTGALRSATANCNFTPFNCELL